MLKQGTFRYLPNPPKVSLIGFFFGYVGFEIQSIDAVIHKVPSLKYEEQSLVYRISLCVGFTLFMVTHWLFTSHYLNTAVSFKFAYTDDDLKK